MAQRGPPFDFDLNESPPPEDDDGADHASGARAPEPMREPSPRYLLPPSPQDTLPPPAPSTSPESSPRDPLPAPVPEYSPRNPLPAPLPEPSQHDALPAPVPESSPHDPVPSPAHQPSPRDPLHPPSPVLDLEAPLSSLDDEDDYDYEEDLPPPPPLPPFGLPIAAVPARSSSSVDAPHALPVRPNGHGEPFGDTAARLHSSPENSAPRGPSRSASGTASSNRSRLRPYSYDPHHDDAISKQRRVDSYDDDAGSSRSGSRRSSSPRRYERSELAPPPHYEQGGGGGRRAPGTHGSPQARLRGTGGGRRGRSTGTTSTRAPPIQKQQGRGREHQPQQGHRGQERPQVHQGHHGPHGPGAPKVGYSYDALSGSSFVRWGAPDNDRQSPEREPIDGNGGYHQRREAPPFRPSSRPRGRWDCYHGRQSQAQEPPKKTGGYHHQRWEAPSLRPSSGAHGRDGSSGGGKGPPQQPINGGAYRQRKAPRGGGERFDRPYHPYARDGGASGRANGGHQAPQPNYEHRRDSKQRPSGGGPSRGRQYYGD